MSFLNRKSNAKERKAKKPPEAFYLTYLVSMKDDDLYGHSSIGISKKNDEGEMQLIFHLGLVYTGQIVLHNYTKEKIDCSLYAKHYPLSLEQCISVLKCINQNRAGSTPIYSKQNPESYVKDDKNNSIVFSIPGGMFYSPLGSNCKNYALSIFKAAGIDSAEMSNLFVEVPRLGIKHMQEIALEGQTNKTVTLYNAGTPKFFIVKLEQYINQRTKESKNRKFVGLLCGLTGYPTTEKIEVAKKICDILKAQLSVSDNQKRAVTLSEREIAVVSQEYSALGRIYNLMSEAGFVFNTQGPGVDLNNRP